MNAGTAQVTRHVVLAHEAVFIRTQIDGLFAAYLAHVERWEGIPDGLAQTMMRQALGAAILHMATRPPDETVAWTLNIRQPPLNLFFTAKNIDESVVGRIFTENVRTTDASRLFVETQAPKKEATRSAIEVKGLDVLQIFEQFYAQSEQNVARFFELSEYDLLMVLGLPDVEDGWMASLDRDSALAASMVSPRPVDVHTFTFRCGCDPDRMLAVMRGLYADKADELFQDTDRVEALCPRCGHRWWISRKDF